MTTVFSIKDIPDFSKKERIVVVGIIGKSPYRYPNKTTPLLSSVQFEENDIECHWDERKSILYLHAVTYLDTVRLAALAADLNEDSKSPVKDADAAHWLVAAGELSIESCKTMALIFNLCHIVVLSSPTPVFDLGYLQMFKAIDAYRSELSSLTTAALNHSWAGTAWEHGRPCCPRLLFHFQRAPGPLRTDPAALKRLEHAMEDQIYFILRKSRLITNVCAKSLFAIPKNEEFVYINADNAGSARDTSALLRGLVQLCAGAASEPEPERPSFAQFLQGHLDLAFGEGFDDNVGKYAMSTSYFELPSPQCWLQAARALLALYAPPGPAPSPAPGPAPARPHALADALDTDVRFSQARCAKVLPIAQASYAEGLPPHYSSQHHAHKLHVALGVVEAMARGPLAGGARDRLRAACDTLRRARELCEAPSLTHHPCIHPKHDGSKEHSSGVRYVSACNCGRSRSSREDPYCARAANYTFYAHAAEACSCDTLQAIVFPVFQPSTPSFRAASVKGAAVETREGAEVRRTLEVGEGESPPGEGSQRESWSPPDVLSPGSAKDDEEDDPEDSGDAGMDVVTVQGDGGTEKTISRQPSTTEYLPGMLHTSSPAALLPAFPSWSLLCIGPSSLYSHSAGLPEHLQPGFLPHTNFLLPWDCAVRLDRGEGGAWRGRGRGKTTAQSLTVKIFIGFEYECPRGHRARAVAELSQSRVRHSTSDRCDRPDSPEVHDVVPGHGGVGRGRVGAGRGRGGRGRAAGGGRHAAAQRVPVPGAGAGFTGATARRDAQGARARHARPQGAARAGRAGVRAAAGRAGHQAERGRVLGAPLPVRVRGRARSPAATAGRGADARERAAPHVRAAGVAPTRKERFVRGVEPTAPAPRMDFIIEISAFIRPGNDYSDLNPERIFYTTNTLYMELKNYCLLLLSTVI